MTRLQLLEKINSALFMCVYEEKHYNNTDLFQQFSLLLNAVLTKNKIVFSLSTLNDEKFLKLIKNSFGTSTIHEVWNYIHIFDSVLEINVSDFLAA